jgi:hypothetical protein
MRCPDCQKFVSLELQDPEVEDGPNVEALGDPPALEVSAVVRICRTCGECGQELKEATLEMNQTVRVPQPLAVRQKPHADRMKGKRKKTPLPDVLPWDTAWEEHVKSGCKSTEFDADDDGSEQIEEGGGRYAKSYFGAGLNVGISCRKCDWKTTVTLEDKIPASHMDEMV